MRMPDAVTDIAVTLLMGGAAAVWRAGRTLGRIEATLESLTTNHLAHLQADLHELRADLRAWVERSTK